MTRFEHSKKTRTRAPEHVRALVLNTGMALFAERGFAGTSLRAVSDASGISVGLIQYHFGTKQKLHEAVKAHAIATYMAGQDSQFALPENDFGRFIDQGLRQFFRFFRQNPAWQRLTTWAMLEGDSKTWPGEQALMDMLAARVRAAQDMGALRPDLDPDLLLIAMGGMMSAWLNHRERYASRIEHLGDEQAREDAYLALCLALLEHSRADEEAP